MDHLDSHREHEFALPCSLLRVGAGEGQGQDRAAIFSYGNAVVAVIADGAGGMSGGDAAADSVVTAVERALLERDFDPYSKWAWCALLSNLDRRIAIGQTTAVVCVVDDERVIGASVGDSGAWLVHPSGASHLDLTKDQKLRPLLGSGQAEPVPFESRAGGGTLLLATDGLMKYAPPSAICRIAAGRDLRAANDMLVRLVRLRSGALADDVGLVLCRRKSRVQ